VTKKKVGKVWGEGGGWRLEVVQVKTRRTRRDGSDLGGL
jgi:hypothetical protein